MTSARESFRTPPLVLCDGRLLIWPDGEAMVFLRDGKSWTTLVLDSRDVGQLRKFMPTLMDNTMHLFDQEVTG